MPALLIGTEKLIIGESAVIKAAGFALMRYPDSVGQQQLTRAPLLLSSRRERVRGGERRLRVPVLQHHRQLLLQVRGGAAAGAGREGVRR